MQRSVVVRVFSVKLLTCLIAGLTSSALAQSAKECFEAAQKTDAVQLWYVNGVPYTDANGNRMMKYTPGKSFFPIGLWGTPGHAEGTLSANMDAGMFDTDFKFDRPIESLEILFNSKYTGPKFSFNYTKDRT
jgi:hypothetical protein